MKDLRKMKDHAALLAQQGKLTQSVAAYQELADAEPRDARWPQKVGELQRKSGHQAAAVESFAEAARRFAEDGFLVKAIALCKVILGMSPNHTATQEMLARLYGSAGTHTGLAPAVAGTGLAPAVAAPHAAAPVAAAPSALRPNRPTPVPAPPHDSALRPNRPTPMPAPPRDAALRPNRPTPVPAPPHDAALRPNRPPPVPVPPPPAAPEPMPHASVGAASGQAAAPARKRVGHRTMPPGAALDAVVLRSLLPDARPQEHRPNRGSVEISLNGVAEAAFLGATSREPARDASALRLPKVPLFSQLDERALRHLIERVAVRHYEAGERIITEGELGESLYVLAEGEVLVLHDGSVPNGPRAAPPQRSESAGAPRERPERVEVRRLTEGAFFGEIALLTHLPRSATVEAIGHVTALELSREVMSDLINEHPMVLKVMLRFFRDRLISTLLETSQIFAPFDPADRRQLLARFAFLECEPGAVLIREGEPADGLYILLCGKLEARRDGSSIGELESGSVIGERSLLGGGPEETSIAGSTKCWALKLDRGAFQEMIMTHPHILAYLSELESREPGESRLALV